MYKYIYLCTYELIWIISIVPAHLNLHCSTGRLLWTDVVAPLCPGRVPLQTSRRWRHIFWDGRVADDRIEGSRDEVLDIGCGWLWMVIVSKATSILHSYLTWGKIAQFDHNTCHMNWKAQTRLVYGIWRTHCMKDFSKIATFLVPDAIFSSIGHGGSKKIIGFPEHITSRSLSGVETKCIRFVCPNAKFHRSVWTQVTSVLWVTLQLPPS